MKEMAEFTEEDLAREMEETKHERVEGAAQPNGEGGQGAAASGNGGGDGARRRGPPRRK